MKFRRQNLILGKKSAANRQGAGEDQSNPSKLEMDPKDIGRFK